MTAQSSLHNGRIIDGKALAATIIADIKQAVAALGMKPGLAVVLVGNDPASSVYVRNKSARAEECGFESVTISMSSDVSEAELLGAIDRLNRDDRIHGILVQLPLPSRINANRIVEAIDPDKDVDGFHVVNAGRLAVGDMSAAFIPCTPLGIIALLKEALGANLSGKHAVVVGRSNIVGKPVAALLLAENCSVSIVHSKTEQPQLICQQADIVVAAVGVARLLDRAWIKPGAVVIDVGINRVCNEAGETQLVGDVDFDAVKDIASSITPVPGGVGPMTIAMLLRNTLESARKSHPQ
ncbi:bifunctional 5,10-methylenetetrahydrofolate dehydrogenase/5,10-methenyltetrahydrofolate cyclohydrolase [Paraburkholderia aspalathi]|uniref:Bifunctional protein FolD n=1 Tax=Paraburkholderia aspalathi TaxID=1324617 RepID=A0A1I7BEV7_9BURK|nr:bifunctional methylenetetrahydrofolate dehydrogenase/methenyltetrahydrofolate cyclohydrolase FolD [Paraburkholderia aspalathi]SFT85642.1 methylenetetrahydrofolate dehydrogenase (NADP+) / methenyltetrahydrofolate cyclohydrolase [Paraburkholderia aspalathi]